jgi:cell wall assembly regulator SMI1
LSYIYSIIQNWQNGDYIEKIENVREQISCTVENLEHIKSNLENILKDLRGSRYIKDIQNIKRELDIYYNGLLNIIKELDTYKQSYTEFKKEYLPKLLSEGLDYIKGYININSNKENINMSLT